MVRSVVLPTPRWPNRPIRCGRHSRSAKAAAGVWVLVMEASPEGQHLHVLLYCISSAVAGYWPGRGELFSLGKRVFRIRAGLAAPFRGLKWAEIPARML